MGFHRIVLWCGIAGFGLLGLAGCGDDGQPGLECGLGTTESGGECVASGENCGPGTLFDETSGQCEAVLECPTGTLVQGDGCVPDGSVICEGGTTYNVTSGRCVADITGCGPGTVLDDDTCVSLDDAISGSVEENPEPNDIGGIAGDVQVPNLTSPTSVYGCILPGDTDGNGSIDIDRDSYRLTAEGPALLDISVDGLGGLAGAFVIRASAGPLADDGWSRTGINLVSDTSRRQVFLPSAGDYFLEILDGRSVLVDAPAGGPDSCYLVSIRSLVLPAAQAVSDVASGQLGNSTTFLSFAPQSDGEIIEDLLEISNPTAAASIAMVHMQGGRYAGGSQGGNDLSTTTAGLRDTGNHLIVVEAEFNYALDAVNFDYEVQGFSAPEINGGAATTVTVGNGPGENIAWTEVGAGEVLRLRSDDSNLTMSALDAAVEPQTQLCGPCTDSEFFYQAAQSGLLYVGLTHNSALDTFDVTLDIQRETPTPLLVDQANAAVALSGDGIDFFTTTEAALDWTLLEGTNTGFSGNLSADRYPRESAGFLDVEVAALETIQLSDASRRAHFAESTQVNLWRIRDTGFDGTADTESYELGFSSRAFDSLAPTDGNDEQRIAVAVDAAQTHQYLVQAPAGSQIDVTISTADAIDLSIRQLSVLEQVQVVTDGVGSGETESVRITVSQRGYELLQVASDLPTGSYDLLAHLVPQAP